ncbi:hypothetical protein [Candidatus Tisiphia endosymbiont of Piscicola geometra]|uniref:hypothetical protein n=1 Tax=Candidatus Tisiphia endosymbiont of Piscicola geometra TaxID=3066273 RepID=UPI00312C7775
MADNFVKVDSKQRWKDAVSKFKRAVVLEQNDLGKLSEDLIDSVRVRVVGSIESDKTTPYLEEIARAKQTINGYEYPILRMGADELKNHQLFYDKTFRVLIDNNNKTATTVGKESKHTKDIQAFILAKDGSLYIGNHKGHYDLMHPTLTHASFLGGRPVEMAGMISINANGKIDMLSSDSGHYAPEALDTYRGIKRLQELMPDIFTPNAQIKYYDTTFHNMEISEFTEMMEESDTNDKPLHQTLRDQRVQESQQYRENLKNAISIKIDSDNDLPNSIANFTKEKQQQLTTGLKTPMMSISIRNSEGKVSTYNISDTVVSVLNSGNPESMQKLLDSGINTRKEFHAIKPLYYATSQGKSEIVKTMLNDPIMQESLKQELLGPAPTTIHRNFNVMLL